MISVLTVRFDKCVNFKYNYNIGSVMQGVLMEKIPVEYAEQLHISAVHPYSQHTEVDNGGIVWVISALNSDANENIIKPLLADSLNSFYIKDKELTLQIQNKRLFNISYDDLFNKHYMSANTYRYIDIEFITPISYKNNGKYIIFPESQMLIKNLIRKYDSASETTELYDELLMEQIIKQTEIVEYRLRSVKYMIEGVKIPAFIGMITMKISGTSEFIRLINMLLEFGEYSGAGIKTAMGMGAYKIKEKRGMI